MRAAVEEAGGRLEMGVRELRDAYGVSRLTEKGRAAIVEDLQASALDVVPPLEEVGDGDRVVLVDVRPPARPPRGAVAPASDDGWSTALQQLDRSESARRRTGRGWLVGGGVGLLALIVVMIAAFGGGGDHGTAAAPAAARPDPGVTRDAAVVAQTPAQATALLREADAALSADHPAQARRLLAQVDETLVRESPALAREAHIVRHRTELTQRYLDAAALAAAGSYVLARKRMLAIVPFRDAGVRARVYAKAAKPATGPRT